ncbi:MAG: arylsulfatase [Opitutae bacterium]|nr:arylsulfatase [Opitutae bacterium]
MKHLISSVILLLLTVFISYAEDRPNIVVIMSDDMGYSDLGCFGGEIRTPNLDKLAAGGLRYTNFYSENMCWVSRASLLTGCYHRTSLYNGGLHPRCVTLPEALRSNGYSTLMSGKWHLAGKSGQKPIYPNDRGFDSFYGILGGAASFFAPHSLSRNKVNVEEEYSAKDYYFTRAMSREAVKHIDSADSGKPLFLYLTYTAAHWPLHAPEADIAKYKGRYSMGWDKLREQRLARMKKLGVVPKDIPMSPRHPIVPAWDDEGHKAWQERRMEVYAAQVTIMDEGIGQVMDALKRTDRFKNTLIFFTIDNGGCHVEYGKDRKGSYLPEKTRDGRPMKPGNIPDLMPGPEVTYQSYGHGWANASNTPYRFFKQYDHEGGIHTPMIAHWPDGIDTRGGIVKSLSHLIDLMPTILDVSGTKLAKESGGGQRIELDGLSLTPTFSGDKQRGHESLFFNHAKGQAIRHGKWKLVRVKQGKKKLWELYDIQSDSNEMNNLATQNPAKTRELALRWESWEKKLLAKAR